MLSSKPATTSEQPFKAAFYREFPVPPLTTDEQVDMVIWWCVNRPDDVPAPEVCE